MFQDSNKLQSLKSKLLALKAVQANSMACEEQKLKKLVQKLEDKKYSVMVDQYSKEESKSDAMQAYMKKLDLSSNEEDNWILMIEKKVRAVEIEAQDLLRELENARKESSLSEESINCRKELVKNASIAAERLDEQLKIQSIHCHLDDLKHKLKNREDSAIQQIKLLKEEITKEQQALQRIENDARLASHLFPLEDNIRKKQQRLHLYKEIECFTIEEKDAYKLKDFNAKENNRKYELTLDIQKQIRLKEEKEKEESKREQEYSKLIQELQDAETLSANIQNELSEVRKLRQKIALDYLIIERHKRRQQTMEKLRYQQLEDEEARKIREDICKEEEKAVLMKISPELVPFLTPDIISKLASL